MRCALSIAILVGLFALCSSQSDGRYQPRPRPTFRPFRPITSSPRRYTPGRYSGDTGGRYSGDSAGRYSGDPGRYRGGGDGRYIPDPNAGKYVHKDDPYKHIGAGGGAYSGSDGRYIPDSDAGKYVHKDDPYKHQVVGGGDYTGSSDKGDRGTGGGYYKGDKDKQYPYKDRPYGGGGSGGDGPNQGAGQRPASGQGPNAGTGGGPQGGQQGGRPSGGIGSPYGGASSGKGDYGRFDKKYDIIHLARKGFKDGNYHYTYETANGILAEETSQDEVVAKDGTSTSSKEGWYEYTGPDGKLYHVDYTAGEDGFVPKADFIPTIPPLIQKALDWLKAHEGENRRR